MEYFIRDKYEKLKYSSPTDIPLRPIDVSFIVLFTTFLKAGCSFASYYSNLVTCV